MADKHKPIIILSDSEDEFTASSYSQFKQSPESQIEKDRLLALALQEEELQAVKSMQFLTAHSTLTITGSITKKSEDVAK